MPPADPPAAASKGGSRRPRPAGEVPGLRSRAGHRGAAQDRPLRRRARRRYNEATFERLREWRLATARAASVPAYVVFTDATLTAIAEAEPSHESELSQIAGVGARKLGLYGAQVLGILQGADVAEVLENASAATKSDA